MVRVRVGLGLAVAAFSGWMVAGCDSEPTGPPGGDADTLSCSVLPDTIDFGGVPMGEIARRPVSVINTGNTTLVIEVADSLLTPYFSTFQLELNKTLLQPGQPLNFFIEFAPADTVDYAGVLAFVDTTCSCITLLGEGLFVPPPEECLVAPGALAFGPVAFGGFSELPVRVRNATLSAITLDPFTLGDLAFDVVSPQVTLAPGDSVEVLVRFAPRNAQLDYSGTLKLGTECGDVALSGRVPPQRFTVCLDGSCDYQRIQPALDVARDADTVLVLPGRYPEPVQFRGRDTVLLSRDGPDVTAIGASTLFQTVGFFGGESRAAVIEGFEIIGGLSSLVILGAEPTVRGNHIHGARNDGAGAGIMIASRNEDLSWSALIEGNLLEDNRGESLGCIFVDGVVPHILDNVIRGNRSLSGDGGAIHWAGAAPGGRIVGNRISDNHAGNRGGGLFVADGPTAFPVEIAYNVLDGNTAGGEGLDGGSGGGLWVGREAWIHHNTIVGNSGGPGADHGGGVFVAGGGAASILENNIVALNPFGGGLGCGQGAAPTLRNNLAWMNAGGDGVQGCADWWTANGNVVSDPLFCDPGGRDFGLAAGSPALVHPAGQLGALGQDCGP